MKQHDDELPAGPAPLPAAPEGGPPLDDERLHRYHDGELSAAERAEVEAALDDEARARLEALDEIGELLRGSSAADSAALESFDVWPTLEKQIAASKVIGLGARLRRRPTAVWAVVSSFAAAAALLLVLFSPWRSAEAADNGCEIESVEATGADVSVMKVPHRSGHGTTTVVWIHPQDDASPGAARPAVPGLAVPLDRGGAK